MKVSVQRRVDIITNDLFTRSLLALFAHNVSRISPPNKSYIGRQPGCVSPFERIFCTASPLDSRNVCRLSGAPAPRPRQEAYQKLITGESAVGHVVEGVNRPGNPGE